MEEYAALNRSGLRASWGKTAQAVKEAELSPTNITPDFSAWARWRRLRCPSFSITRARSFGDSAIWVLPRPAIGGKVLPYEFWRAFAEIKCGGDQIAPFNRYQTIDVIRAVARSGKESLSTRQRHNILLDLLTPYIASVIRPAHRRLLGHWAVWTRRAVSFWNNAAG